MPRNIRKLSDKERILIHVLRQLSNNGWAKSGWGEEHYQNSGWVDPHVAPWREVKVGDLVICQTSGVHEATLAYVVEIYSKHEMLIRGVGESGTIRMSNESFYPVVGFEKDINLFEGQQRWFYDRMITAWRRYGTDGREYSYRFGGLRFTGSNAIVTVRLWMGINPSFDVKIRDWEKLNGKQIMDALRAAGFGTRYEKQEVADDTAV